MLYRHCFYSSSEWTNDSEENTFKNKNIYFESRKFVAKKKLLWFNWTLLCYQNNLYSRHTVKVNIGLSARVIEEQVGAKYFGLNPEPFSWEPNTPN